MDNNNQWLSLNGENNSFTLSLYVQPGSKQTVVSGLHGEAIKLKLAARAQENQANEALLRFLS